jgi:hypothetical protein
MRPGQAEHDKLKAELPESAECLADCPYCADNREKASKEEKVSTEKVYDQESVDALLESARSKAAQEARSEAETELAQAKAALTAKEEELTEAQTKVTTLETQIQERDEKERLSTLADERAVKVTEVTEFSDEQIAERKEGWAKMSEEDFDTLLADFKAVTESAASANDDGKGTKKPPKPPTSSIDGTRETAGSAGTETESMRKFLAGLSA